MLALVNVIYLAPAPTQLCLLFDFQADLRRADFFAKQRALEDALMALEV